MNKMPPKEDCLQEYMTGHKRGQFRRVTDEEYTHAKLLHDHRLRLEDIIQQAKKDLKYLKQNCKHPVCYDTAGHLYDVRHCVICGYQSLI